MSLSLTSKTFCIVCEISFPLLPIITDLKWLLTVDTSWNLIDHVFPSNIWTTKRSFYIFVILQCLYVRLKLKSEKK